MRKFFTVTTSVILLSVFANSSSADCRRGTIPGGAFGIDSGTVCSFGGDNDPVLPDSGYQYYQGGEEPLYSYKEQRAMLKSQSVRGRRGNTDGLMRQSVNGAYRPLGGTSRRVPFIVFGGGR